MAHTPTIQGPSQIKTWGTDPSGRPGIFTGTKALQRIVTKRVALGELPSRYDFPTAPQIAEANHVEAKAHI